jgi:hypothetical protein
VFASDGRGAGRPAHGLLTDIIAWRGKPEQRFNVGSKAQRSPDVPSHDNGFYLANTERYHIAKAIAFVMLTKAISSH